MRPVPLFAAVCGIHAAVAQSSVVNIDFGDSGIEGLPSPAFAGLAAAPDPADASAYWNTAFTLLNDTLSAGSLLDSTGAPSSLALSLGISSTFFSLGEQELGGSTSGAFIDLMGDYAVLDSGSPDIASSATGIFSGLIPANYYEIYLYGQGDNFSGSGPRGQNTLFTLGGTSRQTGWDGDPQGDGLLSEGTEYVKFTVEADAAGQINFTWGNVVQGAGGNVATDSDGASSRFAALNALQIVDLGPVAVPEPSASLLGGLGLLALLRRRRSR